MIEVKNISKSFGEKTVLKNVSFTIKQGEHIALMGKSGVGKTTLLRIIAGLETADEGEVVIEPAAKKTFVFQENRLLEHKSVIENILAVTPDEKKALYFLERTGLIADKDKKAGNLSGGMKRRLAIARALTFGGDIYYFDEPLRELDEGTLNEITALIKEELRNKTAIIITHDESTADILATRIIRL